MNINKAMVFGNLTRDPELKTLPSGMSVASFGIATNRVYNDRDGKRQEQVEYHNIVVFGKQAETTSQYLKKGSSAFIEGRLQTRSWEQDGNKRYMTEIVADRVQFGPRSSGGGEGGYSAPAASVSPAASNNQSGAPKLPDYPEEEINPEDIPF
ncbi:MAG: single-stranded DNA-binding protein [Candidatus Paceibacterota bacterium]